MSEIIALRCDGEGCDVISMPWEAKVKARPRPGKHRRKREHYCAKHYPYDLCNVCGKRLRPYQAQAADWPGTVAKGRSNPPLCTNCYAKGLSPIDTRAKVDKETAAAVRRLVIRHYQTFEADNWLEPAEDVIGLLGLDT